MIWKWPNASLFIAMILALCLGACATETPRKDPFLALAQSLGISAPSCPAPTAGGFEAHSNCTENRLVQSPIRVSRRDNPVTAIAPSNRDNIGGEEATSVPRLNVEASRRYAGDIGADTNLNRCRIGREQCPRSACSKMERFPRCRPFAVFTLFYLGGGGTYSDLLTCLEMSRYAGGVTCKEQFRSSMSAARHFANCGGAPPSGEYLAFKSRTG